jgi:hypothetical protein
VHLAPDYDNPLGFEQGTDQSALFLHAGAGDAWDLTDPYLGFQDCLGLPNLDYPPSDATKGAGPYGGLVHPFTSLDPTSSAFGVDDPYPPATPRSLQRVGFFQNVSPIPMDRRQTGQNGINIVEKLSKDAVPRR